MTKMCWRCRELHEDAVSECPYCGAAFVPKDATYRTDGRTISCDDDDAYLRSAPPRYRKNRTAVLLAIATAIIVSLVAYAIIDGSGILKPDITYDYQMEQVDIGDDGNTVAYRVVLMDAKFSVINWSTIGFSLDVGGTSYEPCSEDLSNLGLVYSGTVSFLIPSSCSYEDAVLNVSCEGGRYSLERDTTLLRGMFQE